MNHRDQQRDIVIPDGVTWFTDGRQQYKNTIGYAVLETGEHMECVYCVDSNELSSLYAYEIKIKIAWIYTVELK